MIFQSHKRDELLETAAVRRDLAIASKTQKTWGSQGTGRSTNSAQVNSPNLLVDRCW